MIFREAVIEDLPAMLDIYNDAIRNTTATFDLEEQTIEERKLWFQKYGGAHPLIVAEVDGQVAGYSSLSVFREKPAYNRTTELSIYIAEAYRGRGIGKAMMTAILRLAKDQGYHTVIGGITGGNDVSIKLHKQFGFELAGSFREVGHKFGSWQDVLFYQLILE
jgi:L-amino acid N-acyltransferase